MPFRVKTRMGRRGEIGKTVAVREWFCAKIKNKWGGTSLNRLSDSRLPSLPMRKFAQLSRSHAAVERVLVALIDRQHRFKSATADLPDGVVVAVRIAVLGEEPVHELEQVPRHA
jgi:hypothetical protein